MKWQAGTRLLGSLALVLALGGAGCDCGGSASGVVTVAILAPADGASFQLGAAVVFSGEAQDSYGALPGDMLLWGSSLDGELGPGNSMTLSDLSLGTHVIVLSAHNEAGSSGQDSISIEIVPVTDNLPPVPLISSPGEGDQFDQGIAVTLRGSAIDPEDGQLPGSALTWTSKVDGLLGNGTELTLSNLSLGPQLITLTALDANGASGRTSVALEIVPVGQNHAPTVTILEPTEGAVFTEGNLITLLGSGEDDEDGLLGSDALRWQSSLDGDLGTGKQLELVLSLGVHQITLTATDSGGKTAQASVNLSVNPAGNEPPVVSISSPADGAVYSQGQEITFVATADDPEDGLLSGAALVWSSNLDGELGNGEQLSLDSLSIGLHAILLAATDSGGASATASLNLRITEASENLPPVAQITAPADGLSVERGTQIDFEGEGLDPEDGALSGASLSWSSNLDGPLGNGSPLRISSLSEGQHTITFTAFDAEALFDQDTISLIITPGGPDNLAPTARLTGPATAMAQTEVVLDGSGSTDADGTLTRYVFDFGDGSPLQDGADTQARHSYALAGSYTVGLTVYDNEGASGETSHALVITPYERQAKLVEDRRDRLGSFCALSFAGNGLARVAYRNATHPSIRLAAELADGSFVIELVEGFGLDLGMDAGSHVDLHVDAAGIIHLAYLVTDAEGITRLRYAVRDATWTLVDVDQASGGSPGRTVALAENPASGDIEILYRSADGEAVNLAVCQNNCQQAANWFSEEIYRETGGSGAYYAWAGDLVIAADGSASASFSHSYRDASGNEYAGLLYRHRSAGLWQEPEVILAPKNVSYYEPVPSRLTLDPLDQPAVIYYQGVSHRLDGSWQLSPVEQSNLAYFDIVFDTAADTAYLLSQHSSYLELIAENDQSYWTYRELGPQDNAWPELALDPARQIRACFARDGNILLF